MPDTKSITVGDITLFPISRIVSMGNETVQLGLREWALLRILAEDPVRIFTKTELARALYPIPLGRPSLRAVDRTASRLRAALAQIGARDYMLDVWGVGYQLFDPQHQ